MANDSGMGGGGSKEGPETGALSAAKSAEIKQLIKSDDGHSTFFQEGVTLALKSRVTRQCSPN
jgi:hypothetical protein